MSTVTEEGQGPGLATRFFIGAAVVIVVTVGLSVALASGKAEGVARERIRGELLRVPALFAGWRDSQMSARRGQVRAVAEQPGTKALLAEGGGGPETAHDTSLEFARALGAGAVFLFDTQGRLIVRTDVRLDMATADRIKRMVRGVFGDDVPVLVLDKSASLQVMNAEEGA